MPRRRRGAKAIAIDADSERGLAMRILLHSPKDTAAGVLAFAAVSAIIVNALFLQAGRHPAPMFGSVTAMPAVAAPANPLPRPRPVEADAAQPEIQACGAESRRSAGQSGQDDQHSAGYADRCPAATCGYSALFPQRHFRHLRPGLATGGGGAAGAYGIWLWPVETYRHCWFGHPGCDPEIRTDAEASGDGSGV